MGAPGFFVDPSTLDATAEVMVDLAGRLQVGRPDPGSIGRAIRPWHAHPDVDRATMSFTSFAQDQFQDAVALLAALSSHLKHTAASYQRIDQETADRFEQFLTRSSVQPFYLGHQ